MSAVIYPVVEGDHESKLTSDFSGKTLGRHFDDLVELAKTESAIPLNDFEYVDLEMLAGFGIKLEGEPQIEWFSPEKGLDAIAWLQNHPKLPDNADLRNELQELTEILTRVPPESKGWRFQMDL